MAKTYVIYYEWPNTASNHAGMAYLFRTLKQLNSKQMRLIKIPASIYKWNRYLQKLYHIVIVFILKTISTADDKIFFVEYLGNNSGDQTTIVIKLRQKSIQAKLYGIVHLSEAHLLELYGDDTYIVKGIEQLDRVIVLGSSLGAYFNRLGFADKVICTYHYVDTAYYKPNKDKIANNKLRIIAMGSLKRNHAELRNIVEACPNVDFDICMGNTKLETVFKGLSNVSLHGFLDESNLLQLMQQADISISVLDDTIGSNVITTSLACGLPQIVSNVGSIQDYCDESNSILCNSKLDFVEAIERFRLNTRMRNEMSLNAFNKAEQLDIRKFNDWFKTQIILF